MSELINNRQEELKTIIKQIHGGMDLNEAKLIFQEKFGSVTTEEITSMEHSLIEEGMDINEVQKLCDVHAAVFDGSISDIHKSKDITDIPGHPANVMLVENEKILDVIQNEIQPYIINSDKTSKLMLTIGLERLSEVEKHYARKENLLFPGLEKRGQTTIPKVMWGVDHEIISELKLILNEANEVDEITDNIRKNTTAVISRVEDMVVKENNILMPLLADTLSLYDWILADEGSKEIGYFIEEPKESWSKQSNPDENIVAEINKVQTDSVQFDAGELLPIELNAILNTVPLDMTFVDKDGHVKYFTQGKERIFDRPKTILGRHVNMCHPPQSVHIVDEIVNSFKNGTKDHEDFWIDMNKMFVHIRYFAIRDKEGNYLGTLEVSQDIKPIRELTGEKRLIES